jgi:histidine triad (HIT) family protein
VSSIVVDQTCVFCRIVAGDLPADVLFEDRDLIVIRDTRPQAPAHWLVVPKQHFESLLDLEDVNLTSELIAGCKRVAELESLVDGFRVVINVGEHAGRVPHLHFHVLGGRQLGWPPG